MTLGKLILPSLLLCAQVNAQLLHPTASMPSFSVVSIHPSNPTDELSHGSTTADSYRAERTTIREVLAHAFGLGYEDELTNPPSWVIDDHFDIQAKLDDDQMATLNKLNRGDRDEQLRLMMQSMLAERFHLTYHFAMRHLPLYQLEIAKSGLRCRLT